MFFGSPAAHVADSRTDRIFIRDLAASLAAIVVLGGLVHTTGSVPGGRVAGLSTSAIAHVQSNKVAGASQAERAAPVDLRAEPRPEEEHLRDAMIRFALSKVAPAGRPQPGGGRAAAATVRPAAGLTSGTVAKILGTPAVKQPASRAAVQRQARKTARTQTSENMRVADLRGPATSLQANSGRADFERPNFPPAEWPARPQAALLPLHTGSQDDGSAVAQFLPRPRAIMREAGSLASGAGKFIGAGVDRLGSGISGAGRRIAALAGGLL